MKIQILELLEGAKQATGLTVIIDVFRAFSLEIYLVSNDVEKIIPVADKQLAYEYRQKDPSILLVGERKGKILPGFDYGNSPSKIKNISFAGKTVVHTTSAGTQGLAAAVHADEIITGSLVNAQAIATYIKMKNPEVVSLVCMGLAGKEMTQEDLFCAQYIQSLLENTSIDTTSRIEELKKTSGAKFFDETKQDVFPQEDFTMCTQLNQFSFVLKYNLDTKYIEKIEI